MGKCKIHGYYNEDMDSIGVGCPECYQLNDEENESNNIYNESHCGKCKKQFKLIDEYNTTFERITLFKEYGIPDFYDDNESLNLSICNECYEKIKKWILGVD